MIDAWCDRKGSPIQSRSIPKMSMRGTIKLSPAERIEFEHKAWQLSLRGQTAPQIARQIEISEKAVDRLLARAREKAAVLAEQDRNVFIAEFVGENNAVISDAWQRLSESAPNGHTVPGLQSNILTASMNKAKVRGLLFQKIDLTSGGKSIEDLVRVLSSTKVPVIAAAIDSSEFDDD